MITSMKRQGRRQGLAPRTFGVLALALLLLLPVVAVPAGARPSKAARPTQLVAKIRWGSDPAIVAADLDFEIVDTLIGSRRVVLLEVDGDLDKARKRLDADSRIKWVEPNFIGSAPEGDRFHAWPSETWPTPADAGLMSSQPVASQLRLADIHKRTRGAGTRVAVLDTGVDAGHPALKGRVKRRLDLIDGDFRPDDVGNGIDDDSDGYVDEAVGHGTHIAGIILLAAPDTTILAYRVLDSDGGGTVFGVAEAIRHAVDDDADVINISFGSDDKLTSTVLQDAIRYAKRSGVLIVAAAGNDGSGHKRYPAAEPDVLSVGAYDPGTGKLAKFASHGKWVAVAAPGVRVTSTVPGGGYATWSGSSMAAPFVSAEAALLLELNPDLSVKELARLITRNTDRLGGRKVNERLIDPTGAVAAALTGNAPGPRPH